MRITKENIDEYLDEDGDLILRDNKQITHIDYIPNGIEYLDIEYSTVEEITCELPDGLEHFYCNRSNIKSLPLLPKSLKQFDGEETNLPKEFQVYITNNFNCNRLRKLQMINSI